MKRNLLSLCCFFLLLSLASCSAFRTRNITYFSDLPQEPLIKQELSAERGPVIKPEDLLSITVSNVDIESSYLFNRGLVTEAGATTQVQQENAAPGYLVSDNGYIDLPVLGEVKAAGLTRQELSEKLSSQLKGFLKEPVVKVRLLNFKVTVLGEVNSPSVVTAPNNRLNIMEALGLVGDMTIYGKRENVLVIREENGERTMARLNLNNRSSMQSPYFYLHQNDVVYVEPDKAKLAGTGIIRQNWGFAVGLLSTILLLLTATNTI